MAKAVGGAPSAIHSPGLNIPLAPNWDGPQGAFKLRALSYRRDLLLEYLGAASRLKIADLGPASSRVPCVRGPTLGCTSRLLKKSLVFCAFR
jgi:hypothetical protein